MISIKPLENVWILCKKNISLYVKRGPVLIFGLMFPFFMTLSWIIGRNLTSVQIFVGIVSMTTFFTSTAISPVVLPQETREKSLERQLLYPLSINQILLGIILASFIYSFIISLIITITFALLLSVWIFSIMQMIALVTSIALMATLGSLLGLLVSAKPTDMTSDIMILINIIKFPLLFISGIFIPLGATGFGLVVVSLFSPITFFTDLLRFSVNGSNFFYFGGDFIVLISWIFLLSIANILIHSRTMRFRLAEGAKEQKAGKRDKKG